MKKTLIIGYGNFDREDDGVSWHILTGLVKKLGRPVPDDPNVEFENTGESPDFLFTLQLMPELSELFAEYDRVCFVDAHTGNIQDDLNIEYLESGFQKSPFTHHMTPSTCLSLTESLYKATPEAILVSVRGYNFDFKQSLSPKTHELAAQAVEKIYEWLFQI